MPVEERHINGNAKGGNGFPRSAKQRKTSEAALNIRARNYASGIKKKKKKDERGKKVRKGKRKGKKENK